MDSPKTTIEEIGVGALSGSSLGHKMDQLRSSARVSSGSKDTDAFIAAFSPQVKQEQPTRPVLTPPPSYTGSPHRVGTNGVERDSVVKGISVFEDAFSPKKIETYSGVVGSESDDNMDEQINKNLQTLRSLSPRRQVGHMDLHDSSIDDVHIKILSSNRFERLKTTPLPSVPNSRNINYNSSTNSVVFAEETTAQRKINFENEHSHSSSVVNNPSKEKIQHKVAQLRQEQRLLSQSQHKQGALQMKEVQDSACDRAIRRVWSDSLRQWRRVHDGMTMEEQQRQKELVKRDNIHSAMEILGNVLDQRKSSQRQRQMGNHSLVAALYKWLSRTYVSSNNTNYVRNSRNRMEVIMSTNRTSSTSPKVQRNSSGSPRVKNSARIIPSTPLPNIPTANSSIHSNNTVLPGYMKTTMATVSRNEQVVSPTKRFSSPVRGAGRQSMSPTRPRPMSPSRQSMSPARHSKSPTRQSKIQSPRIPPPSSPSHHPSSNKSRTVVRQSGMTTVMTSPGKQVAPIPTSYSFIPEKSLRLLHSHPLHELSSVPMYPPLFPMVLEEMTLPASLSVASFQQPIQLGSAETKVVDAAVAAFGMYCSPEQLQQNQVELSNVKALVLSYLAGKATATAMYTGKSSSDAFPFLSPKQAQFILRFQAAARSACTVLASKPCSVVDTRYLVPLGSIVSCFRFVCMRHPHNSVHGKVQEEILEAVFPASLLQYAGRIHSNELPDDAQDELYLHYLTQYPYIAHKYICLDVVKFVASVFIFPALAVAKSSGVDSIWSCNSVLSGVMCEYDRNILNADGSSNNEEVSSHYKVKSSSGTISSSSSPSPPPPPPIQQTIIPVESNHTIKTPVKEVILVNSRQFIPTTQQISTVNPLQQQQQQQQDIITTTTNTPEHNQDIHDITTLLPQPTVLDSSLHGIINNNKHSLIPSSTSFSPETPVLQSKQLDLDALESIQWDNHDIRNGSSPSKHLNKEVDAVTNKARSRKSVVSRGDSAMTAHINRLKKSSSSSVDGVRSRDASPAESNRKSCGSNHASVVRSKSPVVRSKSPTNSSSSSNGIHTTAKTSSKSSLGRSQSPPARPIVRKKNVTNATTAVPSTNSETTLIYEQHLDRAIDELIDTARHIESNGNHDSNTDSHDISVYPVEKTPTLPIYTLPSPPMSPTQLDAQHSQMRRHNDTHDDSSLDHSIEAAATPQKTPLNPLDEAVLRALTPMSQRYISSLDPTRRQQVLNSLKPLPKFDPISSQLSSLK